MNTTHTLVVSLACLGMATDVLADGRRADRPAPALEIERLGTYAAGIFGDEISGAEISAHDPRTQRLFVVNGAQNRVDVVDIRNPAAPTKRFSIDCAPYGGQPNSVAVSRGLVAVAVQAVDKTQPGKAVFFDTNGGYLASVTVGALPDMITFTPNGQFALTANEGEPNADYTVDPEGSVSIIDVRGNIRKLKQSDVRTAAFTGWNSTPLDASVRVFGPGATVAQDLEPEYITVSRDSRTAYVTLQEANAIATIDIRSATVTAIKGLGFKDHARVDAVTELFEFDPAVLPSIGATAAGQPLFLGGFSGLAFEGIDPATGRYRFLTHTDRGPNGEPTGIRRPFLLPGFSPEIVRFELDRDSGELALMQRIPLKRADGVTPITGLPNLTLGSNASQPYNDEVGVDLLDQPTGVDPLGGDFEGIVVDPTDGSFWMCDEYRPALYHFRGDGVLIDRFVPIGTAAAVGQPAGTYGTEALPAVLAQRRQNRGFEAIALSGGRIYAFVQSPARNPASLANGALNAMQNVRLVEFDPVTHATRQFIYVMDNPNLGSEPNTRADKIGDMVAAGAGEFLVVERDDDSISGDAAAAIEKKVYRFGLTNATDVSAHTGAVGATGRTVDQLTTAEMLANGITPVMKTLQVDLAAAGYDTVQKVEGLALVDPFTLAVINDNDFQVAGIAINPATGTFSLLPDYRPEPITLGLVDMQTNSLDASDREISSSQGAINIRPWPVKGMYLPDAIASFEVCGRRYLITANEGDSRDYDGYSEEERVKDVVLDPIAFPLGATVRKDANLGRLKITSSRGDTDGDGDFDELYSFGGRSFSIWDGSGALVYDSGDALEQIIAADPVFGPVFNAGHTNNTRDDRSDDKGPEPEAVVVGRVGHATYAFVGLERIGGFMVFDVGGPTAPRFVAYVNHRDPAVKPALGVGGDFGPEGLLFIGQDESPVRVPLLVVSNEVSSTVTLYRLNPGCARGGRR
ncbi:MAG: esterase-like activity of phytase family protein [Opitutaceae bacterium]|nr:esterase-like activity of phytase family protein [Opitutaceae bacterium]